MVDDSGAAPLPRRVPGASASPNPPVRVDRSAIPEDLRQRVLAAIATELEHDSAAAEQRRIQAQAGAAALHVDVPADVEPPAPLRRGFLPPELLGRRLTAEAMTEPLPRIGGFRPGEPPDGAGIPDGLAAATPPEAPPAVPEPQETAPPAVRGAGETAPPEAAPSVFTPSGHQRPGTVPPDSVSPPSALTRSAPPWEAPDVPPAGIPATVTAAAAAEWPSTEPFSPDLSLYSPPAGPNAPATPNVARSDDGGAEDAAAPPPTAGASPASGKVPPSAARRPRPGRPYRIAGLLLAVVLVVVGIIVLMMSGGGSKPPHPAGLDSAPGAGAALRDDAVTWVAAQVSRTAVVACDPVTCQALRSRGVPASSLYSLGPQTASPLRSQIIVATAAVRARFGARLGSVYAPAVLASFGSGPDQVDIRATAQHGAAAYRASLSADVTSRQVSGRQLLHSHRISVAPAARGQLAAGQVDARLLVALAEMAAAHPMYIAGFGAPAPGAAPGIPLRQVDLSEDAHAYHHLGHKVSTGYVRSMVSFLDAQRGQFRPASVQTVQLTAGAAVLHIVFSAPSPMGLLGSYQALR